MKVNFEIILERSLNSEFKKWHSAGATEWVCSCGILFSKLKRDIMIMSKISQNIFWFATVYSAKIIVLFRKSKHI